MLRETSLGSALARAPKPPTLRFCLTVVQGKLIINVLTLYSIPTGKHMKLPGQAVEVSLRAEQCRRAPHPEHLLRKWSQEALKPFLTPRGDADSMFVLRYAVPLGRPHSQSCSEVLQSPPQPGAEQLSELSSDPGIQRDLCHPGWRSSIVP